VGSEPALPAATESENTLPKLELLGTLPNPMRGPGRVHFSLAEATPVRLAVYDVRGRLVRTLAQRSYSPGPHSIDWEPRAEEGTPLSQGIYFVRLDVGDRTLTRRFVLIR